MSKTLKNSLRLFLISIFLFQLSSFSQETLSGVQRAMARVEKEIKREKRLHKLEKKKAKEFNIKKKNKISALNNQITLLGKKKKEIRARVGQLKRQKASLKGSIKHFEQKHLAVSTHLQLKMEELIAFFEKDYPHQLEKRIQILRGLQNELKEGLIGPEEGINRMFTYLKSAIDLGYETEVYSHSYTTTEGKKKEGKFLRLGTVISAFVSLDGNTVAYQTLSNGSYTWTDKDLSLNMKQNIKSAIQIAEGKAAPELVLLPFIAPSIAEAN